MRSIHIVTVPHGHAPEPMRRQWKGMTLPLATEDEVAQHKPSNLRVGTEDRYGYFVLRRTAITYLRNEGRHEAASYWAGLALGPLLEFEKEACELFE